MSLQPQENAAAVQVVRTLRAKIGTGYGTIQLVAIQLGYGTESVRLRSAYLVWRDQSLYSNLSAWNHARLMETTLRRERHPARPGPR